MTTYPSVNVIVTPDVTCRVCREPMPKTDKHRVYECVDCGKRVRVEGEYERVRKVNK